MTVPFATRSAYIVSTLVGAATWLAVVAGSGRREAWDSELYFTVALPAIGLSAAILAFLIPGKPWRWAFVPFAGQAGVAVLQNPTGSLLPLGLIVFAFFGAICTIPAYAGAGLRRLVGGGSVPRT